MAIMKTMTVTEFKAACLAVIAGVERTGERVILVKRGRKIAEIGPVSKPKRGHPQETLKGTVTFVDDIVSPAVPPEAWEAERRG